MKEDKNKTLEEFFSAAAQTEIPDEGFSNRVMQGIGSASDKRLLMLSRIWTSVCCLLGIAFVAFWATRAGIQWHGARDIIGAFIAHLVHIIGSIQALTPSSIPHYVYPIPLLTAILLAIAAIRNESKQTIL